VNVLLVDDSRTFRKAVSRMLRDEPDIQMVYEANDGEEGVSEAVSRRPDLVLMDLEMPNLDGYGAIDRIMRSEAACPIVVLSGSVDGPASYAAARCFEVGAVEVLSKPTSLSIKQFRRRLISVLRTMSKARVVRRKPRPGQVAAVSDSLSVSESLSPFSATPTPNPTPTPRHTARASSPYRAPAPEAGVGWPKITAIGSSTGGPPVLSELMRALPKPPPCPVVIAQHILPGFDAGLARWLASGGLEVVLVDKPMRMRPGTVYLAPGDRHMVLSHGLLDLTAPKDGDMVPSADELMASVAREFGKDALGIVLTGMGRDGAQGLLALREAGAKTYAQSAESCAVNGMPQAARDVGAVERSLPPPALALMLSKTLQKVK
jgi:two-component system chemotaxis response regulator CheB